jgi:nitrate/nitrite transport system permease protein
MNLAIFTLAAQAGWKKLKPIVLRDVVLFPALGFLG